MFIKPVYTTCRTQPVQNVVDEKHNHGVLSVKQCIDINVLLLSFFCVLKNVLFS